MIVLSRKTGEKLIIEGDGVDATLTVDKIPAAGKEFLISLQLWMRPAESISIGDDIDIHLSSGMDKWGNIRIGVDAPREIRVVREEIY